MTALNDNLFSSLLVAKLTASLFYSLEAEFQVDLLLQQLPSPLYFSPFFLAILTTEFFLPHFYICIIFVPYVKRLELLSLYQRIISDIAQGTTFLLTKSTPNTRQGQNVWV